MVQQPTHGPDGGKILSVTEFTRQVKVAIENAVPRCWVRGEISNLTHHGNGHIYFSLKDTRAQVSCVLFRQDALRLPAPLKAGQEVVALGEPSLYEPQGRYQLICRVVVDVGQGELQRRYEALKAKLEAEGLFAAERKRPLPLWPKVIAVVTSPTGAAIADFISILSRRGYRGRVVLIPSRVQGEGAKAEIVAGIHLAGEWATRDGDSAPANAQKVKPDTVFPPHSAQSAAEAHSSAQSAATAHSSAQSAAEAHSSDQSAAAAAYSSAQSAAAAHSSAQSAAAAHSSAQSAADAAHSSDQSAAADDLSRPPTFPRPDLLVVMRGGGSLEDLWSFNEEVVARALAASPLPTVSAVGHQIDFSLSDFAADVRAETPSGAAELIAASFQSLLERRQSATRQLAREVSRQLEQVHGRMQYARQGVRAIHPQRLLERHWQRLDELRLRLNSSVFTELERARNRLGTAAGGMQLNLLATQIRLRAQRTADAQARLERLGATALLPLKARLEHIGTRLSGLTLRQSLARGYALVRDRSGSVVSRKEGLQTGQLLAVDFADGEIIVRVEQV